MKLVALSVTCVMSVALAACDEDIDKILMKQEPEGGYLITRQNESNFIRDGVNQIGALYYVERGKKLSTTTPESIKVLCAVIAPYGSFPVHEQTYDPTPPGSTEYAPSAKIPDVMKSILGGVTLGGEYSYKITYNIKNLKYSSRTPSDLKTLYQKINSGKNCESEKSALPEGGKNYDIFQLVGIGTADIDVAVKTTGGLTGTLGGLNVGGKIVSDYSTNTKGSVFKVYNKL